MNFSESGKFAALALAGERHKPHRQYRAFPYLPIITYFHQQQFLVSVLGADWYYQLTPGLQLL